MAIDLTKYNNAFFKHFEEKVIYKPRSGSPREVLAVVDRNPQTVLPELTGEGVRMPFMVAEFKNSSTAGIDPIEYQEGDELEVAVVVGDNPESRTLGAVISHDAGTIAVEVR